MEESNIGAPSHQFSICEKMFCDWRWNNKKKLENFSKSITGLRYLKSPYLELENVLHYSVLLFGYDVNCLYEGPGNIAVLGGLSKRL